MILRVFAAMSPTVGLIWASAIRIVCGILWANEAQGICATWAALGSFCTSQGPPVLKHPSSEDFLRSADFGPAARCAPRDSKAQRAAAFGKLGMIGFVLHDCKLRGCAARISRGTTRMPSCARRRAR